MPNHIKIWPWKYAPKKYKKLSKAVGDEDFLVFIPGEYIQEVKSARWLQVIDSDSEPQMTQLENGDYIYIGGHT